MSRWLKQSTAFTFRIGPFLDAGDGVTAETGLSIGQADIQISKNGGAFAQTSASPTATHDADGWYQCPLTTTDTGTLGSLTVQIVMAGALPVWEHFMVVPANVYDSLIGGSDNLQVDAVQIEGADATDTINAQADLALSDYDPPTNAELTARTLASADYFDAASDTVTVGTNNDKTGYSIATGGITAASIATDAIDADSLAADAIAEINATVDTALADYDAPTKAELDAGFTEIKGATWATTDTLEAIRDRGDAAWTTATGFSTLDAAGVRTAVGLASANLDTQLDAIPTAAEINAEVDTALTDYDGPTKAELDSGLAALNDLSAAQVNAEVVDVLRTDAIPDSYSTDGSHPTLAQAILEIRQFLMERAVSSTTVTVKKPDGSTTAMTFTLDDDAAPTSITRAT